MSNEQEPFELEMQELQALAIKLLNIHGQVTPEWYEEQWTKIFKLADSLNLTEDLLAYTDRYSSFRYN